MVKVRRALISVSDKTGIVDFARALSGLGVEILSTGGTAKLLRENNIPATDVSDYTGFPEMLDGRVKTLHPKIHGGLLALRDNPEHMAKLAEHNIGLIDMVVVNLYPFEKTTHKPGVSLEEVIENIDIGGPSMLRSAAKNHRSVAVVCNPVRYSQVLKELKENGNQLSTKTLEELGIEVFSITSRYDGVIYDYLRSHVLNAGLNEKFPEELTLRFKKVQALRYGENPHQAAAFYGDGSERSGLAGARQLWGKELSFNNILDLNAAVNIVAEFQKPAAVFIKHNNPCGVAENNDILKAYRDAWVCDKLSAFGGIVGINRKVELNLAKLISKSGFLECVIAPAFSAEALELLKAKKNVRLMELPAFAFGAGTDLKKVNGGLLVQEADSLTLEPSKLKVVTKRKPTKSEMESLLFAWKVSKHVKSNAIIFAKGTKTVGIGAGQMSRVDSVTIARIKSGKACRNAVLASDAFFPKEDAIVEAKKAGIKAIIQPGGSIADDAVIATCNKYKIAMVFTGIRHFRH